MVIFTEQNIHTNFQKNPKDIYDYNSLISKVNTRTKFKKIAHRGFVKLKYFSV